MLAVHEHLAWLALQCLGEVVLTLIFFAVPAMTINLITVVGALIY